VGERFVHLGRGEDGIQCFGHAIRQQRAHKSMPRLPWELRWKLERDFDVDPTQPIRILPYEWVTLIGHIAMLDTYKRLQLLGLSAVGQPILLAPKDKIANSAYFDLWREHFHVIDDEPLVSALFPYQRFFGDCFNGYITPEGKARCWTELGAQGRIAWDADGRGPLLKLPDALRQRGYAALKKFGFNHSDWFVALHVRGGGYHGETKDSIQTHRNAQLGDYMGAISRITNQGGWVVRMGDSSMEPLPKMDRVIDYACSDVKSDWMDVFLAGSAAFFVGTTSGLSNAVLSLGTPCLLVNCISNYYQLWDNRVLFMLKPLWSEKERRYLRVSEMTDNAFRWKLFNIQRLGELGIVPHSNTPEEIQSGVVEIMTRLKQGLALHETDADRALRAQCHLSGNRDYFGNGRISNFFHEAVWRVTSAR
jgi:putative glycosyltransferase (TIGR04372 family)